VCVEVNKLAFIDLLTTARLAVKDPLNQTYKDLLQLALMYFMNITPHQLSDNKGDS